MKQAFSDQDVIRLLSGLKTAGEDYPVAKFQPRRATYMKQAAAMAITMKTDGGTGPGLFSLGTFLETALVITIMVEAVVAAYIYRDQIADFINSSISPGTEAVAATPTDDPSLTPAVLPAIGGGSATGSPAATVTVTVIVTDTPFPILVTESSAPDVQENSSLQVESTHPPVVDNPGNHYGNTPQPERTKDAGNNPSDGQDTNKENKGPKN